MLIAIIKKDLQCVAKNLSGAIQPLGFFVIVTSLFPLSVSPDPKVLQTVAPGIIWISALLATLLTLDTQFKEDYANGALDQMFITDKSLYIVVCARIISHWLISGLPLVIACLLVAMILHIPTQSIDAVLISLILGTPVLSMVGSIGAALTVGLRYSGILLTLIALPLYIPVLIFGTSCISADLLDLEWAAQAYLLGAILALSCTLAPFATAAALRININ